MRALLLIAGALLRSRARCRLPPFRSVIRRDEPMTDPTTLSDDEIETVGQPTAMADPQDADGTDGDATDGTDGDAGDADGGDDDATDGDAGDADATDR
jgi:hypothetical protein